LLTLVPLMSAADACLRMFVVALVPQVKFGLQGPDVPRVDTVHETIAVLVGGRLGLPVAGVCDGVGSSCFF